MSNADTRDILASITVEQLQAVREIIEAAPRTTDPETISAAVGITVHDAIERRFEIEKMTKAAMEAVFVETNTHPKPSLVEIIVASVWDQVNTAQNPDGHDHDGLLPGDDAPVPSPGLDPFGGGNPFGSGPLGVRLTNDGTSIINVTDKDYLQELQIAADKPDTSDDVRERGVPAPDFDTKIDPREFRTPDPDSITETNYRDWRREHGFTDEREADDNPPIAVSPQFGAHRAPDTTPLRAAESVADDPSTAE